MDVVVGLDLHHEGAAGLDFGGTVAWSVGRVFLVPEILSMFCIGSGEIRRSIPIADAVVM